jgi:hypothetical protein
VPSRTSFFLTLRAKRGIKTPRRFFVLCSAVCARILQNVGGWQVARLGIIFHYW